jgi:hypothetical protein
MLQAALVCIYVSPCGMGICLEMARRLTNPIDELFALLVTQVKGLLLCQLSNQRGRRVLLQQATQPLLSLARHRMIYICDYQICTRRFIRWVTSVMRGTSERGREDEWGEQ